MQKITVKNYRNDRYYSKITTAVSRILSRKNFVAPIDVFTEMGLLTLKDVERWKRNEVPCLERVIQCNLAKAGRILRILRFHAHDLNLGPSMTVYKRKGRLLRFSMSGERRLEEAYSRHLIVIGKSKRVSGPPQTAAPGGGEGRTAKKP